MAPGASRRTARSTLIKLLNYHWVLLGPANIFKVSYVNRPSPAAKFIVVPPAEEVKAAEEGGATFHTTSAAVAAARQREEKRQEMATLKKEPDYRAMLSSDAAKSLAFKDRWRIGS